MISNPPDQSPTLSPPVSAFWNWIVIFGMAAAAFDYVIQSLHWPLMLDSPIMHYVVFLMQHGLKPYSQITDMNMPGAYLAEWFAMRVFGPSDLSWRIYEYFLLGVLTTAMCIVAGRRNRIAGIYGGGLFLLMHAAEGARQAVERDEVIAVLILLAYAAMFTSVRLRRPLLMLAVGLASGSAASIKPTFLLFGLFLLEMTFLKLRREQISAFRYIAWGAAGIALPLSASLGFLLHYGVVRDFWFILHTVIPAYTSKGGLRLIAVHIFPRYCVPIVPFAILALVGNQRQGARWDWERWALTGGIIVGLASYAIQGKGFSYHRYEFLVCLFLLFGMEMLDSIRSASVWRWAGLATIIATAGITLPLSLLKLHDITHGSDFTPALENDLRALGGADTLRDRVVCLDMTTGCINALYHVRIVENGGYTGDMLLFTQDQNEATRYYRNLFFQRSVADPPQIIVLSNQDMFKQEGFNRLDNWPEFESYLRDNFTEVIERTFRHEGMSASEPLSDPHDAVKYRIYISRHSPLLTSASHLLKP